MSFPVSVTTSQVMDAVADQLLDALAPVVAGIQVEAKLVPNPTPPCVDIFPGDPFLERTSFGPGGGVEQLYTVRARVSTADNHDGQELLLAFMDAYGPASIWAALELDASFGGVVDDSVVESVSGFLPYESAGGAGAVSGALLGAEWRLRVSV